MVNFDAIEKALENQYRILINRIFELKSVQFTELPFRNQEFAEKIDKNLKKLDKTIKFGQIFQNYVFFSTRRFVIETQYTQKICEKFYYNPRPKEKIIKFPEIFLVALLLKVSYASFLFFHSSTVRVPLFSSKTSLSQNFSFRFLRLLFRILM